MPEEFLHETDVDSYFNHNIIDVSQSQLQILRVSKGFNKTSFFQVVPFLRFRHSAERYILQNEDNIFERELSYLVDCLRKFRKFFHKASKCL